MASKRRGIKGRAFDPNGRWLGWGLVLGGLVGTGLALWFAPRSGADFRHWATQSVSTAAADARKRVEDAVPTDPVAQSLAEGKEAARKRRDGVSVSGGQPPSAA